MFKQLMGKLKPMNTVDEDVYEVFLRLLAIN